MPDVIFIGQFFFYFWIDNCSTVEYVLVSGGWPMDVIVCRCAHSV